MNVWRNEHTRLQSPISSADQQACYNAVKPWSALALAQSVKESQCGKTAAAGTRNALNLFVPAGTGPKTYAAWADGYVEWYQRMADPHYKGSGSGTCSSVYCPRDLSLEGWTATYIGGPGCWSSKGATCANNEKWKRCQAGDVHTNSIELAIQQAVARVNSFMGHPQETPWTAAANAPGCTTTPSPPSGDLKTEADVLARLSNGLSGVYISFGYAERNPGHPIYAYGKGHMTAAVQNNEIHPGIDVWMPDETPVNSLFAGEVVCVGAQGTPMWGQGCGYFSDDDGGLGNITILHDVTAPIGGKQRQLKLTYGHMSSATVQLGQKVAAGERIGRSGKGGNWPHVHLDVVANAPELNNPNIWNNGGEYHLNDPIPTILVAVPMAAPPLGQPTIYTLKNDYARFGLTKQGADTIRGYCFQGRSGQSVLRQILHVQEGTTPGSLDWWLNGYVNGVKVQASSTAMIQQDGSILRVIDEDDGPWTNGDTCNPDSWGQQFLAECKGGNPNLFSRTVEFEGYWNKTHSNEQLDAGAWWVKEGMSKYGLGKEKIGRHANLNTCSRPNCCGDILWNGVTARL